MHTRDRFLIVLFLCCFIPAAATDEVVHVIREGESLYGISREYNVPVSAVQEANEIQDPSDIAEGVELVIPSVYEVQKGDTYYSIARTHGLSVDELLELNERSASNVLKTGETLYVPDEGEEPRKASNHEDSGRRENRADGEQPLPAQQVGVLDGENYWPHPGSRDRMDGKLPGMVIHGSTGDEVKSISTGRVIFAGPYTTFGRVVMVQSATGHVYVYGGNRSLSVSVGDLVRPGTRLGELGEAPDDMASRLYFSVWKNDSFVDPAHAPRS